MSRQPNRTSTPASPATEILTFLIADVRGYTTFTQSRGDEAAATLAATFAEIAREGVEARGGSVIELRGDEALAVFGSARQALRAALELQEAFADETELNPSIPLRVGIGLDAGEAVPVEDGYRGGALNLAARLCSKAGPFEVLASQGVVHLARAVDGVRFEDGGTFELKGLSEPVGVVRVLPSNVDGAAWTARIGELATREPASVAAPAALRGDLPPELDPGSSPIVGRDAVLRWLRWNWRLARRGPGRVVVVGGAKGVGTTRIVAEVASLARAGGAAVRFARGASLDDVRAALGGAMTGDPPAFVVVDGVDEAATALFRILADRRAEVADHRMLVVVAASGSDSGVAAVARETGADDVRVVGPLDADAIVELARRYTGERALDVPAAEILRQAGGMPLPTLRAVAAWAGREATRRLGETAGRTATGRTHLRSIEAELAGNVVDLQMARERARTLDLGLAADTDESPFKGLESFDVHDADRFFGRERLVAEMVARLAGATTLAVIGPSGSGKSSALRAGLVASLSAGVLPGSDRWILVVMRPGAYPLRALDRSVWSALPESLRRRLESEDLPLRAVRGALGDGERMVLVVDQFEELFTLCSDEDERAAFVRALVEAATDPAGNVTVVASIRADYYGRCADYPDLAALLGRSDVLVGPMSEDEYRRAIELPAQRVGVRFEPALVDALVAEVVDEPGSLPLLSTALLELWQTRDGRTIRFEAYARTSGVRGAVARLAEAAFQSLTDTQRERARAVMLRLAGEGDGDAVVRRRVAIAEFDAEHDPDVARILEVFTDRRLITVGDGAVEVSHEALLREWPRMQGWLDDDREGRRLHLRVIEAAKEWQEVGRDPGELYRGARLATALDWTAQHAVELNDLERTFIGESRAAAERDALRQRRTNRRLRVLLAGAAIFLVVALVAGALAVVQRGNARRSAERATTAARIALAQSLGATAVIEPHIDLAMLEAREAMNLDVSLDTRNDLLTTLTRSPRAIGALYGDGNRIIRVAVSPDGKTLAVNQNDNVDLFVDTATGRILGRVGGSRRVEFAFSPDGRYAITPLPDSGFHLTAIQLYDAHTFRLVRTIPTPAAIRAIGSVAFAFAFSTDGKRVALSSSPRPDQGVASAVAQWDTSTWTPVGPSITSSREIDFLGYRGGQGQLVASTDQHTTVYDARTGHQVREYPFGSFIAALSSDDRTFVFGKPTGEVDFADLVTGKVIPGAGGHTAQVNAVVFTPDGHTVATAGDDRKVVLWDAGTHAVIDSLTGHAGRIPTLAMSKDGSTLYSGSLDGSILAWDMKGDHRFGRTFTASPGDNGDFGPSPNVAFSPDGTLMATGETNGTVDILDTATLRRTASFPATPGYQVGDAVFVSNDTVVVAGDRALPGNRAESRVVEWRLTPTPTLIRDLTGMQVVPWVTVSSDGRWIVAAGTDPTFTTGRIGVWDASTGQLEAPVFDLKHAAFQAVVARDGRTVAAVFDDGSAAVIDAVGRRVERQWKAMVVPPGLTVAFSPDERTMATGGWDGYLGLWDVRTGKAVRQPVKAADGPLISVGWSPDGRTVLTGGFDGTTRLFDAATGRQVGLFPGVNDQWEWARFSPDASKVAVVYSTGQGFLWPSSLQSWEGHACAVAHRAFTRQEWSQLVPGHPYQPVCTG